MLLILCCSVTFAQQSQDTLRLKHFSTWAIAPYISAPIQNTDIEYVSDGLSDVKLTGVGLNIEKHLSHNTSFQVGVFNASMYPKTETTNYRVNLTQYDARFYFHITNGNVLRTWRNTQIYFYGGAGRLSFIASEGTPYEQTAKNKTFVGILGGGAKYRLGNKTSLFMDGSYNQTTTDRLEGVKVPYTSKDAYYKLSVGLTYTLGKKRIIEWDNPYQYLVPEEVHDTTVVIKTIKYEPAPVEKTKLDSVTIYYLTASTIIEAPYLDDLDQLVDRAVANGYSLQVESYCDATGSTRTNVEVVTKRANNVVAYISKSISSDKITVSRYDESFATYAPDARNRRVVVKIIK